MEVERVDPVIKPNGDVGEFEEVKEEGIKILYLKEGHICIVNKPHDVFIEV